MSADGPGDQFTVLVEAQKELRRENDRLREDVDGLIEVVNGLMNQPAGENQSRRPVRYSFEHARGQARADLWHELADFVDYLNRRYGSTHAHYGWSDWYIPDWWWQLPAVAEELTALMAAWHDAYRSATPGDATTAMIAWHDRWYWPCMERIFNDTWGLKIDTPPDETGSSVRIAHHEHDRTSFTAFVDEDVSAHPDNDDNGNDTGGDE